MFSRFASRAFKPTAAAAAFKPQTRCFSATLGPMANRAAAQGSKGRQMPKSFTRATEPASGVEATLTIRDGPVFHGTAFGANANISGEAVFTTSLVGYPEVRTATLSSSLNL